MMFKLKFVLAGMASVAFATGALAAGNGSSNGNGNGNAGQGGVSFNAVLHSNGLPSGVAALLSTTPIDTSSKGLGGIASEFAHTGGGISVAMAASGNPKIIPSVPEPDAYLMLLAGLGMVGVIARRRASR